VLYESGAAAALNLIRYPARVSGVSYSDLLEEPSPDDLVYDLFSKDSLTELVINVCTKGNVSRRSDLEPKIRGAMQSNPHFQTVIRHAAARWVFIAGNIPRARFRKPCPPVSYDSKEYQNMLIDFIHGLTMALLEAGFNVASCPQVLPVGGVVARTAGTWLYRHSQSDSDRYQIGGLYPIDRHLREKKMPHQLREQMHRYLIDFRKRYLNDKEWLITIGGSDGTAEESKVAKDLGVRVFAVPCFGGASWEIWNRQGSVSRKSCLCLENCGKCDPKKIVQQLIE